jgi:hypothetical protein
MFKLPSIKTFIGEAANTFKRFPLVILVSFIGTLVSIYLIHCGYQERASIENSWKVVMCCYLGLNLFLATELFSESKSFNMPKRLLLLALAAILILTYCFTLPHFKNFGIKEIARYVLFTIGLHLLVAIAPYTSAGHLNGFWQFNKSLFLRFLTSCLYTGVLYLGLSLALLAIDKLFKVSINSEFYFDLWWTLAGIFNTWFFLAGIPKHTQTLDVVEEYPKGLKIFTQFVLLPLIAIYLFILYAYGVKIAAAMELPRGWVSYLVLGFSVTGILSLLLIWPIREQEGNSWVKMVDRWFYRALYPLIVLLGLAIFKRVTQYGITENRYFILVLALWLLGIATYFLFSKRKNIKSIPISLCVIAFLSSFGPWGAFSISEHSQVARLESILIKTKILQDGKIKKADTLLRGENAVQIVELVRYLNTVHGFAAIEPWFTQHQDSIFNAVDSTSRYSADKNTIVLDLMGVDNEWGYSYEGRKNFYFRPPYDDTYKALNIKGFDYYNEINIGSYQNESNADYKIIFDEDSLGLVLKNNALQFVKSGNVLLSIDLQAYITRLKANNKAAYYDYEIPKQQLIYPVETDSLSIQLNFTSIAGTSDDEDSIAINNISAYLLIKHK